MLFFLIIFLETGNILTSNGCKFSGIKQKLTAYNTKWWRKLQTSGKNQRKIVRKFCKWAFFIYTNIIWIGSTVPVLSPGLESYFHKEISGQKALSEPLPLPSEFPASSPLLPLTGLLQFQPRVWKATKKGDENVIFKQITSNQTLKTGSLRIPAERH